MKVSSNFLSELYCAKMHAEKEGCVNWSFNRLLTNKEEKICKLSGFDVDDYRGEFSIIRIGYTENLVLTENEVSKQIESINRHYPVYYFSRERFKEIMNRLVEREKERDVLDDLVCKLFGSEENGYADLHYEMRNLITRIIKDAFNYHEGYTEIDGFKYQNDCPLMHLLTDYKDLTDERINEIYDFFLCELNKKNMVLA